MSVIARRIRATPERPAVDTWRFIVSLARRELEAVGGVAACLIADEVPKEAPIVLAGSGPRLRIYCLYGEEALTGEGSNETDLTWDPTVAEWMMWLPTAGEDLEWVRTQLAKVGKRIVAYDPEREKAGSALPSGDRVEVAINVDAFKGP